MLVTISLKIDILKYNDKMRKLIVILLFIATFITASSCRKVNKMQVYVDGIASNPKIEGQNDKMVRCMIYAGITMTTLAIMCYVYKVYADHHMIKLTISKPEVIGYKKMDRIRSIYAKSPYFWERTESQINRDLKINRKIFPERIQRRANGNLVYRGKVIDSLPFNYNNDIWTLAHSNAMNWISDIIDAEHDYNSVKDLMVQAIRNLSDFKDRLICIYNGEEPNPAFRRLDEYKPVVFERSIRKLFKKKNNDPDMSSDTSDSSDDCNENKSNHVFLDKKQLEGIEKHTLMKK